MDQLIACFDLETSNLDPMFGIILCGVIKPWGEEPMIYRNYHGGSDDSAVVGLLIEELRKYPILVAHNGVFFDRKFINGRALRWNMEPLDPKSKMIDPWRLAKNHLNFRGNSLDRLSDFLGTEHKKTTVDGDVWLRAALDGDQNAMQYIVDHCVEDTYVLEEVCYRLRKFTRDITMWGSG